jgi:hypothetical protein
MHKDQTEFVAVLVFDVQGGRHSIEPHVFTASHPEIAYQCALAKGNEPRFSRRFIGLAELTIKSEDVPPIGWIAGGSAAPLVQPRELLAAFNDPRWAGKPHDPAELANAMGEPPLLVEVPGLDAVPWDRLSHAYGLALDVPIDLRRLASSDPKIREAAHWQLAGSIYHQGSIYEATAAAVPFLISLASHSALPNRAKIVEFLGLIAASAVSDPEKVRTGWRERVRTRERIS